MVSDFIAGKVSKTEGFTVGVLRMESGAVILFSTFLWLFFCE
jgi:hypothetical protein